MHAVNYGERQRDKGLSEWVEARTFCKKSCSSQHYEDEAMFGCKAKIGPVLSSLIEDDERNGDKKT